MTFEDVIRLTRRRIITILLGVLVGVAISLGAAWLTPVSYEASADAYVRVTVASGTDSPSQTDSYYAASQLAAQKVKAFVSVFTSEVVAQGVIDTLGLDSTPAELSDSLTVAHEDNTLTITVSAKAPSAAQAERIADEVVVQAGQEIRHLEGEDSPIEVLLMSPSSLSGATRSPSLPTYIGAGILGGVALGYAMALTRQALDRRLRSAADVSTVVDRPVLGIIPNSDAIGAGHSAKGDSARADEAFRKLRTNLLYASIDEGLRTLVVSAAVRGEGTSLVASNLARVMALAGQKVILIDGDLRRRASAGGPEREENQPGLTQLLVGSASLDGALVNTAVPGLQRIPAGDLPPNPSELLGSERMAELLTYLASQHIVIVDAPPVLPVTDAVALGARADGVLLVARAGRTTQDQLRQATAAIGQGGGSVLGIVLNRAASSTVSRLPAGASS